MKIFCSIFFIVFFIKCYYDPNKPMFIQNLISNEKNEFKNYEAYYIIPPTICTSCNSHPQETAYLILKEGYPAKVIFECFPENLEILKAKLEFENVIEKRNYIIDTLLQYNIFDSTSLVNSPIVVYLNKGNIHNFEILDADNPQAVNNLINKFAN